MSNYTYKAQFLARTMRDGVVVIPDQVADDQKGYDGKTFPVLRRDGRKARAMLMGDEYGLRTPGVGDPVVKIV